MGRLRGRHVIAAPEYQGLESVTLTLAYAMDRRAPLPTRRTDTDTKDADSMAIVYEAVP